MKNVIANILFAVFSVSSISFAAINVQPGAYCQLNDKFILQVGNPSSSGFGYHQVKVSGAVFNGAAFDGRDLTALTKSVRIGHFEGQIFITFTVYQDSFSPYGKMSLNQVNQDQYELSYEHDGYVESPLSHYVKCVGLTVQ